MNKILVLRRGMKNDAQRYLHTWLCDKAYAEIEDDRYQVIKNRFGNLGKRVCLKELMVDIASYYDGKEL